MKSNILVLLIFVVMFKENNSICMKSRGFGRIVHTCLEKQQLGLLCYEKCEAGFYNVATICWETCPSDMMDLGLFCWGNPDVYFNGCNRKCPNNYDNYGCLCVLHIRIHLKRSHDRAPSMLRCDMSEEFEAGFCYSKCGNGYKGFGPFCWTSKC